MKKKLFFLVSLVAISIAVTAQKINTDSLAIISKISDYQLKRAKLQNTIKQTTQDKQDAATKVQTSAEKNSQDARRLNDDPQDKKLAKDADNAASDARSDSKRARNANKKLDNLNKEISEFDAKIAQQQRKLSAYTNVAQMTTPIVSPVMTAAADTTHPS